MSFTKSLGTFHSASSTLNSGVGEEVRKLFKNCFLDHCCLARTGEQQALLTSKNRCLGDSLPRVLKVEMPDVEFNLISSGGSLGF